MKSLLLGALLAAAGCAFAAGDETAADPVATIGGEAISAQELDLKTAPTIKAQEELYQKRSQQLKLTFARDRQSYRENQLNALLDERALALEAKAKGSTPDGLLAALEVAPVQEQAVHDLYEANKAKINLPYEAASEKLRAYLQAQATDTARREYVRSLRTKYRAQALLPPRREEVAAIGPHRGPDAAKVTIVEFSDFQCPFCGRLEPAIREVMTQYPTKVRLVYRHFPLPDLHPDAEKAAEAAVCADRQGKFWEMHDLLFAEQSALGMAALKEKAHRLELDAARFDACLDSGAATEAVRIDRAAGETLGLLGTPGTFVNGRFLPGELTVKQLTDVVEQELNPRQLTAAQTAR